MTAYDQTPLPDVTEAGKQAAADKAAAAARMRQMAQADGEAAWAAIAGTAPAEASAAADGPAATAAANHQAPAAEAVTEAPSAAPCAECEQRYQALSERLALVQTQLSSIGKLILVGVLAGVAWYLTRPRPVTVVAVDQAEAPELTEAEPAGVNVAAAAEAGGE